MGSLLGRWIEMGKVTYRIHRFVGTKQSRWRRSGVVAAAVAGRH